MPAAWLIGVSLPGQPTADRERALAECRTLIAQQHVEEALVKLQAYGAAYPESAQGRYLLAYALYAANRPRESLAAYTEAARLKQPSASDLLAVSADYILLEDYADAAHWLQQVTTLEPGNVLAWYYLGRSHYLLQQYSEATAAYRKALSLAPSHVRALTALGLVQEAQGQADQATHTYELAQQMAEKQSAQDAQPWIAEGELEFKQNNLQKALPLLQAAKQRSFGNPRVEVDLGRIYQRLSRFEDAEAAFGRAEALAPDSPSIHFLRGGALQHLGRQTEARAEFKLASSMFGSHSSQEVPDFDFGTPKHPLAH